MKAVYYTYVSGVINSFHETKEEAEKAAKLLNETLSWEERNGCEAIVGLFNPGELYLVDNVWCHGDKEVAHQNDIPWLREDFWIIDDGLSFEIVTGEKPIVLCEVYGPFESGQECLEYIGLIDT